MRRGVSTLIAPSRRLWTPPRRQIRWCPVHPVYNMAAGDRLLSSSGNRFVGTTGNRKLSNGTACCCGADFEPGDPCESCTGDVPSQVTVTFSDVIICTCARTNLGNNVTYGKKSGMELNGTYCLSQRVGHPCTWWLTIPAIIEAWNNNPPSCTGTGGAVGSTDSVDIYVVAGSTTRVMARHSSSVVKFFDGESVSLVCAATKTISNSLTSCGSTSSLAPGAGSIPAEFDSSGSVSGSSIGMGRAGQVIVTAGC
jgi:hypothetical protein